MSESDCSSGGGGAVTTVAAPGACGRWRAAAEALRVEVRVWGNLGDFSSVRSRAVLRGGKTARAPPQPRVGDGQWSGLEGLESAEARWSRRRGRHGC
jgi:hypothetical protein